MSCLKHEVTRKSFHLSALIIPVAYHFVTKDHAIRVLAWFTISTIFLDLYRHYSSPVRRLTDRAFSSIMRPHEYSGSFRLSGISYMLLSFLITALLFSRNLTIAAWNVLVIADTAAALVGRRFGTSRNNHGKSLEGALAFFISALITILVSNYFAPFSLTLYSAVAGCAAAAIAESHNTTIEINDNFVIPLVFASTIELVNFYY